MNLQEIQDILQPVDQLWDAAAAGAMHLLDFIGFESRNWQGYGWREEATGLVVSPFVDSPEILSSIVARISALLPESIKVEGLVLPPFLEIGSVPRKQSTQ